MATANTSLLMLPASNLRPPKTDLLVRFETALAQLNDFYWGARAGFHTLTILAGQGAQRTDGFLPPAIGQRWSMPVADVPNKVSGEEGRLRYLFLVQAVTYYEDYVASMLREELGRLLVPTPGTHTAGVQADIQADYLKSVVSRVVNGKYSDRAKKLHKVLGIAPANTQPRLTIPSADLTVAGEVRNCIIHSGGVVDDRAFNALQGKLSSAVVIGQPLPLSETDLFRLVGALKTHVEAVDLLVRLRR